MAVIKEYALADEFGQIMEAIQKGQFDESTYYSEMIFESWRGLEDFALMYGIDTSGDNYPFLMSGYELSKEQREMMLQDERFVPYIEVVRERFLPAAQPGQMFYIDGQVKSFSETNWCERFDYAAGRCQGCRDWYYSEEGFFPYVVEEDDGSVCFIWHPCRASLADIPDDACLIKGWNEDGNPCGVQVHCDNFEWD